MAASAAGSQAYLDSAPGKAHRLRLSGEWTARHAGDLEDLVEQTANMLAGKSVTLDLTEADLPGRLVCGPDCASGVAEIQGLVGVKDGADARLAWTPDGRASGYNVWTVEAKEDIELARQSSAPPAVAVAVSLN